MFTVWIAAGAIPFCIQYSNSDYSKAGLSSSHHPVAIVRKEVSLFSISLMLRNPLLPRALFQNAKKKRLADSLEYGFEYGLWSDCN